MPYWKHCARRQKLPGCRGLDITTGVRPSPCRLSGAISWELLHSERWGPRRRSTGTITWKALCSLWTVLYRFTTFLQLPWNESRACSSSTFFLKNFLFGNKFKLPKSHNENYKEHLYPCPHLLYYLLTLSPSRTFFSLELTWHTHRLFLPLNSTWASLVAQLVKNPPAMQETWVESLSWEDPLEKGKATHSSILDWRIP